MPLAIKGRVLYSLHIFCFLCLAACGSSTIPEGDYAITNVTVIPMTSNTVLENQTVVVQDEEIIFVGPSTETSLPADIQTIDGTGKYLAPGLADMHVHIGDENDARITVSYGVTTVRNMWGMDGENQFGYGPTIPLKESINNREIVGPTIYSSGALVDGAPKRWRNSTEVDTTQEAITEVRRQANGPYDFIKVYTRLKPEVLKAIADEAKKHKLPIAGHLPSAVSMAEGIAAGMATMEHMYGFERQTVRDDFDFGAYQSPRYFQVASQLAAGQLGMDDIFDPEKLQVLADMLAKSDTWICPTLMTGERIYMSLEKKKEMFKSDRMALVEPTMRAFWNPENDARINIYSKEELAGIHALRRLSLNRVKVLHEAGVKLLVGTDVPNPFIFAGFSVHEEMDLFVEAGVPTYDTIYAATAGPANFFGETGKWGVVAEGARADLVLLSANPLDDITNYRQIEGVMAQGSWHEADALQAMRAKSAKAYDDLAEERGMRRIGAVPGYMIHEH